MEHHHNLYKIKNFGVSLVARSRSSFVYPLYFSFRNNSTLGSVKNTRCSAEKTSHLLGWSNNPNLIIRHSHCCLCSRLGLLRNDTAVLKICGSWRNYFSWRLSDIWQDNWRNHSREPAGRLRRGSRQTTLVLWEKKQETKGCFGWSSTHPIRAQWANHVTRRFAGARAAQALPGPRYHKSPQHWQKKKELFGEGLEGEGLVLLLLTCSRWFRFRAWKLTKHPRGQRVSNVMCGLMWFYLFPSRKH